MMASRIIAKTKGRIFIICVIILPIMSMLYLYARIHDNFKQTLAAEKHCTSELISHKHQLNTFKSKLEGVLEDRRQEAQREKDRLEVLAANCTSSLLQSSLCQSQFDDLQKECKKLKELFDDNKNSAKSLKERASRLEREAESARSEARRLREHNAQLVEEAQECARSQPAVLVGRVDTQRRAPSALHVRRQVEESPGEYRLDVSGAGARHVVAQEHSAQVGGGVPAGFAPVLAVPREPPLLAPALSPGAKDEISPGKRLEEAARGGDQQLPDDQLAQEDDEEAEEYAAAELGGA